MESYLRDILEKKIETLLSEKSLSDIDTILSILKTAYSNEQDTMFGYIVRDIASTFFYAYSNVYDRRPTESEIREFGNFLLNYSNRIKSRISLFLNK